jgi:AbiU2
VTRRDKFAKAIGSYSTTVRIRKARKLLRTLDDIAWEILAIHANNQHLLYSQTLLEKVPTSRAAHAFSNLRDAMSRYELVRIASIWDGEEEFGINLPSVVALIDDSKVLEKLEKDEYARHASMRHSSAKMEDWAETIFKNEQKEFATARTLELRTVLHQTINDINTFKQNKKLETLVYVRHKYLAHNLTQIDLETRNKKLKTRMRIPKLKFGDESFILKQTVSFIENLHLWVCGTNAISPDSARIHSDNASELWSFCEFKMPDQELR